MTKGRSGPPVPTGIAARIPTLARGGAAVARWALAGVRAAPSAARALGRFLARPPVVGAAYLLALTIVTGRQPIVSDNVRALGTTSGAVESWLSVRYATLILELEATFVLVAVALGATFGFVAGAALRLRRWSAGRAPLSRPWLALGSLELVALFHGVLWARSIARNPQYYDGSLYALPGAPRALQVFITDTLGVGGADALLLVLVAFVLPPPWRLGRPVAWIRARAATVVPIALLAAAAAALWCIPPAPGARDPALPPNVILLCADSFRDDELSTETMPRLTQLAARSGARFSGAQVSMARTMSSWATTLTGLYAQRHGVQSMFPRWEEGRGKPLDALPARLRRAGYRTEALAEEDTFDVLNAGIDRTYASEKTMPRLVSEHGFLRALPLLPFLHSRAGRRVFPTMRELQMGGEPALLADEAVARLPDLARSPFFLTVFFAAPHYPYSAPAPYYRQFTSPDFRGAFRYQMRSWGDDRTDAATIDQLRGLHRGTLKAVDDASGRILDEVARLGLTQSTIVVVFADHGENLFDAAGRVGHGGTLWGDHDRHIPFVIIDPRHPEGRVVGGPVNNADIAPTLYELTGVAGPPNMDGISLAPAMLGAPLPPRPQFAETELWLGPQADPPEALRFPCPSFIDYAELDPDHGDAIVLRKDAWASTTVARHRMVVDGRWKLIYIPTATGVVYKLFDVASDPENLTDVAAAHPEEVERLKPILWRWMLLDPRLEERHGFLAPKNERLPEIDGPAPKAKATP